jgi:DNA integrity scanning protein DisA with diadenylate cyclase activity
LPIKLEMEMLTPSLRFTEKNNSKGEVVDNNSPSLDFSFQYSLSKEYLRIEKKIFDILKEVSKKCYTDKNSIGCIVVYGSFDTNENHVVRGMRQIGINPVQKFMSFGYGNFKEDITKIIMNNNDGAIIVDKNGQILGIKVYLTVENPSLDVPEGCGTRHITAASFSQRKDVISVMTLSEENLAVRKWKEGSFTDQFFPSEEVKVEIINENTEI